MKIETATREFLYNGVALKDPNPSHSLEQVREFYSAIYPEILSAAIEGPTSKGAVLVYEFRRAVGTKGAAPRPAPAIADKARARIARLGVDKIITPHHAISMEAHHRLHDAAQQPSVWRGPDPALPLAPHALPFIA